MKKGKLRILYIHQHFTTREGWWGTKSYEFSKYLVSQGHRVTMITGITQLKFLKEFDKKRLIQRMNIDGIDTIATNVDYSSRMSYSRRTLAFILFMFLSTYTSLKEKTPDVVFATSPPLTVGIPGIITSKFKKIPFVFEVRDIWPESAVEYGGLKNNFIIKLAEIMEHYFYRNAKKISVISKWTKNRLIEKGVHADKLEFIPTGADVSFFSPLIKGSKIRSQLDIQEKFVVLYAGNHGVGNGLDKILDASKELKHEEDIVFIFIGDGKEKSNLIQQSKDSQLKNVIFLDPKPKSEMPEMIAAADVCLISLKNVNQTKASVPNKLFDYLASGKPVLVNFKGDSKRLLEKHNAGVYVEPDNARSMAEMILKMKHNPKWRSEMGRNARKLAEGELSRLESVKKLEKIFYEVNNENLSGLKKDIK